MIYYFYHRGIITQYKFYTGKNHWRMKGLQVFFYFFTLGVFFIFLWGLSSTSYSIQRKDSTPYNVRVEGDRLGKHIKRLATKPLPNKRHDQQSARKNSHPILGNEIPTKVIHHNYKVRQDDIKYSNIRHRKLLTI